MLRCCCCYYCLYDTSNDPEKNPHTILSHRRSDDPQRMRLRVEDEPVRAPFARDLEDTVLIRVPQSARAFCVPFRAEKTHRHVYQIRILQDLGKQETLLHVEERPTLRGVDVRNGREALTDSRRCVDGDKGVPGPVLVHRVALVFVKCQRVSLSR